MKIAVINPYGGGAGYSGPAVFAGRLFRSLADHHDITLVLGRRASERGDDPWVHGGVALMTFRRYGPVEQVLWAVRALRWLLRNAGDYDVVHIHGAAFFNLVTGLAAIVRRTEFVLVALAAKNDLSAASKVARMPGLGALRRFVVSRASVGFALSDDIAAEFVGLGLAPRRVVALNNPVDTAVFAPAAAETRDALHTLGFVGILGPRKRPHLLLDAMALLRERGFRPVRAVFVGPFDNDRYEQTFRDHASRLDLAGAIEVVGYTHEVWRWTNTRMSVLVLPSAMEGLPGALVEAMASGLPAVVTEVGAMGTVVRAADAGFVVLPEATAIADRVAELWRDEVLWTKFSAAARAYACAHFDVSSVVRQYLAALAATPSSLERKHAP